MPICYRDKTFCTAKCEVKTCYRYADENTLDDAKHFGLPIAWSDFSKACPHYTPSPEEGHWFDMEEGNL